MVTGRNICTTEKSPSVIITVRTGVVPSAAQTEPMRASSAMGATTCTAAVGRFTAGVGVAQLFTAAEECLRVAFAAVQDHVLAGVGSAGQQHRTAAGTFIRHKFYPECVG